MTWIKTVAFDADEKLKEARERLRDRTLAELARRRAAELAGSASCA